MEKRELNCVDLSFNFIITFSFPFSKVLCSSISVLVRNLPAHPTSLAATTRLIIFHPYQHRLPTLVPLCHKPISPLALHHPALSAFINAGSKSDFALLFLTLPRNHLVHSVEDVPVLPESYSIQRHIRSTFY